jgi:hypothetical protein
MSLLLMYITNNLDVALIAQKYGVERIWIDLETLGKEERQMGKDTVKSHHTISDISKIKPYLTTSEMLVRVNPWNDNSKDEIDKVIESGADIIMLPYWKTLDEVKLFINAVNGRCKTTLLLETKEAVKIVDDVLGYGGFDEIHIGLNDLHLSYGLDFMFELLTDGTVEMLCNKFAEKNLSYGFGGIARIGDGAVPAEKIILEHYRLGSTRAILSRSFCDYSKIESILGVEEVFAENMKRLREYELFAASAKPDVYMKNKEELALAVSRVAGIMRARIMENN